MNKSKTRQVTSEMDEKVIVPLNEKPIRKIQDDRSMVEWKHINWQKLEKRVYKLQKRIYKASNRGDIKAVRRLQKTLMKSWAAKCLAVRRVTQDNQGKKTAGVDGVKKLSPAARLKLVDKLKLNTKAKPTRRVWIPKPGTDEKRPLGIPTMKDRALQALVKLALEPEWVQLAKRKRGKALTTQIRILYQQTTQMSLPSFSKPYLAEARFEPNSYGFRPGRSCHDAIGQIYNAIRLKPKYVLDADIAKCFNRINHETLLTKLNTFPTIRRQIRAWLKAEVMDDKQLFPTSEGTPQGGVISPSRANIALNEIEEIHPSVRYADDMVFFLKPKDNAELILDKITKFLAQRGLNVKASKIKLVSAIVWI